MPSKLPRMLQILAKIKSAVIKFLTNGVRKLSITYVILIIEMDNY